jgi:preprotein translocase subunit SecE
MPLPLIDGLVVLVVIAIVGAAAYLIDQSTERHERTRDR